MTGGPRSQPGSQPGPDASGTRAAQRLDRVLTAYRIGDPDGSYPIFDATGSRLAPGRWNTEFSPMIYASAHYSTAMLEKLVHGGGRLPPNQHYVEITIPSGLSYEVFSPAHQRGWDDADCLVAKAYGEAWQRQRRSVLLIVPSIVARMERNYLINPDHGEFGRIAHALHEPVWWDGRLFPAPAAPADTEDGGGRHGDAGGSRGGRMRRR